METINFSAPMRQSKKGIVIIFGAQAFKFVKNVLIALVALIISLLRKNNVDRQTIALILLGLIGILLVLLIISILKYLNFKFHLSENDFFLSRGIINKERTIIPKSKIQNVFIKQNLLQQLINVVSVTIETAGDENSEIEISALDRSMALALKSQLFSSESVLSNDVTPLETQVSDVYFKVSFKRLFLEGITQNHIKSFGIMAAFLFGIYFQIRDFAKDLEFTGKASEYFNYDERFLLSFLLTNVIVLFAVVIISIVFSVIRTFVTNLNLEVIEHKNTIEINKGLFQKISLSLTPSRIQNIIIKTNRFKQFFGLHSLYIKQAMTTKKQQKNLNIVALGQRQVKYLTRRLFFNLNFDIKKYRPSFYYIRILILRSLFFILFANILAFIWLGSAGFYVNIFLVIIVFFYSYISFKKAYYYINDDHIFVGGGFIDTITNILEIHKIQAVRVQQSYFQRRRKIASVVINTASKAVKIPYIQQNEAENIRDYLLYKVESQNKDWM